MNEKKVAKGSFYTFISQAVILLTKIFLILFLARILGPFKYGRYAAIFAFCLIIEVGMGGISSSIAKEIASKKEKIYSLIRFAYINQFVWSAFIFLAIFLGAKFWSIIIFNDISFTSHLRVASLYFIPIALFYVNAGVLIGQRKIGEFALLNSSWMILRFFIILIFLLIWKSVDAIFYAIFIVAFLGLIPVKFTYSKIEKRTTNIDKKKVITFALSLLLLTLTRRSIFQVDKLFIKNMLQNNIFVGNYALASNFAIPLQLFSLSLTTAIYPSMAASFTRKDLGLTSKYLKEGTRYLLLLLLPVSFALNIIGKDIILFVVGNQYFQSIKPFTILIFASVFFSFFLLFSSLLVSINKQWSSVFISASILTLALLLNPLFIKKFGFIGAAWTTLICSVLGSLISGFYIFKLLKSRISLIAFLRIFTCTFFCYYLATLAGGFPCIIRYSIYSALGVIFILLLCFTKELTKDDWQVVKNIFL